MASKPSGVTGGQLALGASDAPRDYNSSVFCTRQRHCGTAAREQFAGRHKTVARLSDCGGPSLQVIEPLSQSDRACNPLHHRTLLSASPLWHRQHVGRVMVKTPLAFEFSKTRCDAFDEAWALLQGLGTDFTDASKSHATRTTLAKRIIEMANQGLRDIPELRDDALAFLQHSPPSAWRNGGSGRPSEPRRRRSPSLAGSGVLARRLSQPQPAHIAWQAWATAARERRAIAIFWPLFIRVCPKTSGGITKFSEHEAD